MPQIQRLRLKSCLKSCLKMPWLLALVCFGLGARIETATGATGFGASPAGGLPLTAASYCGSTDMIPNCNLIASCGGIFSSPIDISTSNTSNGSCGFGKLRAETIEGSSGRRKLVCLDVSSCTGTSVCKYNKGASGDYDIGFKCLQKD